MCVRQRSRCIRERHEMHQRIVTLYVRLLTRDLSEIVALEGMGRIRRVGVDILLERQHTSERN